MRTLRFRLPDATGTRTCFAVGGLRLQCIKNFCQGRGVGVLEKRNEMGGRPASQASNESMNLAESPVCRTGFSRDDTARVSGRHRPPASPPQGAVWNHFDSIFHIPFHSSGGAAASVAQRSASTRLGRSLNSAPSFSKSDPATVKRPAL